MRVDLARALLVALAVAVLGAMVFAGVTSGVAFDAFNPDWDGTSELRSTAEAAGSNPIILDDAGDYAGLESGDVAFVLEPTSTYDDRDVAAVRSFVESGGTLVVAERDGPHGSALLAGVGASARPDGALLRDERDYFRSPAFPVASVAAADQFATADQPVAHHELLTGVETVTLNHGTAVEPNGATVLVATSDTAYLDRDGSGDLSGDEEPRSYAVVTVESVGDGQVIVVGDASVFINVMIEETANDALVTALVDDAETTAVDVSHAGSPPPLVAALFAVRGSVALQLGVGLLGVAGLALAGRGLRRSRPSAGTVPDHLSSRTGDTETRTDGSASGADSSAVAAGLERLHPELDSETLRKLTNSVIGGRSEADDDD